MYLFIVFLFCYEDNFNMQKVESFQFKDYCLYKNNVKMILIGGGS